MALAALVSAAACLGAWRVVPWQGRQSALVMAAGMLLLAVAPLEPLAALALGAVLLVSGMLGTAGVRGTAAAATCCHRALVSLVMAACAFQGAVAQAAGEAVTVAAQAAGEAVTAAAVADPVATVAGGAASAAVATDAMGAVASAVTGHAGHGLDGVLSVFVLVGGAGMVLWTVLSAWLAPSLHHGRTARLLATESWAMAAGVAAMCLAG